MNSATGFIGINASGKTSVLKVILLALEILNNYLSSGTVKEMIIFTLAQEVLQSGGYIVVDEVENHFNKEIVTTLLRFFMDSKLNRNGITVENLSNILKRNDIKKSDAYQSGFLEGTTPTYEAYMQLKKSIASTLGSEVLMELANYKVCICEGSAENAIIDILLDYDLMIFKREEMIEEEVLRCREGKKFEQKYLRKEYLKENP